MENKIFFKKLFLIIFVFTLLPVNTQATILDSYFGINLSVDGSGNFNNSWLPTSSTADYIVDDWYTTSGAPNPSPFGTLGEALDVEAIYFDNDSTFAYFAIVTSNPSSGYSGSIFGWPAYNFDPGDIAIDLNSDDPAFNYQYGIKTIGSQAGEVRKDATWFYDKGSAGFPNGYPDQGFSQTPKFNLSTGTFMGSASSFSYYDAGITENGWSTWIIEGMVMLSQLGSPSSGSALTIRFSPDCNNDLLFLNADIELVPEPSSILLLGVGIAVLLCFKKRKD